MQTTWLVFPDTAPLFALFWFGNADVSLKWLKQTIIFLSGKAISWSKTSLPAGIENAQVSLQILFMFENNHIFINLQKAVKKKQNWNYSMWFIAESFEIQHD